MTDDDIDPAAKPTRRTFSAEYKAEILAEYDTWPEKVGRDHEQSRFAGLGEVVGISDESAPSSTSQSTTSVPPSLRRSPVRTWTRRSII